MIEREINGLPVDRRRAVRQERSAPLLESLETWMREKYPMLSRHDDVAKAMNYMLKRWDGFARFIDDGRICLTNNRRRACNQASGAWEKSVALLRFRPWRAARSNDV